MGADSENKNHFFWNWIFSLQPGGSHMAIFRKNLRFWAKITIFLIFSIKKIILINHIIANENFPLIVRLKFIFEGLWWKNKANFGVFGHFFKLSTQGVKITISDFLSRIFILNSKTSCRLIISWCLTFKVHFRCYRPAHFLHLGSQSWKVIPKSLRVAKRALRGSKIRESAISQ